jgi:hypothetical protein
MSAPDKRQAYPALPRTYVVRKRLWEQLDESDAGAVTLLVAPAGAGKTLGVSGWLRLHGRADGPDPRTPAGPPSGSAPCSTRRPPATGGDPGWSSSTTPTGCRPGRCPLSTTASGTIRPACTCC